MTLQNLASTAFKWSNAVYFDQGSGAASMNAGGNKSKTTQTLDFL